jgi:hypothetical protein
MTLHLCQGPKCHTHDTQSRVRGPKGAKVLRTRKARFNMNVDRDWIRNWEHYFCDERCMNEWLDVHMVQLINYVGIQTRPSETPIDITEEHLTNWAGNKYTRKTIRFLSEPDIKNNVLT